MFIRFGAYSFTASCRIRISKLNIANIRTSIGANANHSGAVGTKTIFYRCTRFISTPISFFYFCWFSSNFFNCLGLRRFYHANTRYVLGGSYRLYRFQFRRSSGFELGLNQFCRF